MFSSKLINRYAIALLEIAEEKNMAEKIYLNARQFIGLCNENRSFYHLLKNPVFLGKVKFFLIKEILAGKFDELFISFIRIVMNHNREILLKEIFTDFIKLYKKSQGIIEAEVITAAPVEEEVIKAFSEQIIRLSGYPKVELTNIINKNIIGGFILKFDNKLLDISVAEKLKQAKKQILPII